MVHSKKISPDKKTPPIGVGVAHSKNVAIEHLFRPHDWKIPEMEIIENQNDHRGVMLRELARKYAVNRIYAPKPTLFNGRVCRPGELKEHFLIERDITIYRGANADGVVVPRGAGFFITSADCPTIVLCDIPHDILIAAHAGLWSLLDKSLVFGTSPQEPRPHASVVDAIMAHLPKHNREHLEIIITCGIDSSQYVFDPLHPQYGGANKQLLTYLDSTYGENTNPKNQDGKPYLSLKSIIKHQFERYGIDPHTIHHDGIDTYSDVDHNGDYKYWSNARAHHQKKESQIPKRNGVFVAHKRS